jgi:integrase
VSPVIVVNKWGRPYTESGFRASFFKLIRKLKDEGKVGLGLTFHGLRHMVATQLADAGADDRTIMAITGHTNPQMVRRYTERADKRKRATAAMRLLEGGRCDES